MFLIFIIAVIGAVAFFHYTQGFFSATISVVICVLAAVLAVSYHEQVATLLAGWMPNVAYPVSLLLMFAIIYLVLRTIIDSTVPGNVTMPAAIDKAGAAVMGIVAGVFAAGLVALAAQEMPVGPAVLGYTRFTVDDRETSVPIQPRALDRGLYSILTQPTLDPNAGGEPQALVVPVDDILINTVQRLSEGGSLASGKELTTIHPAWLTELFGQRLGIEPGGKRVAMPEDGTLVGLYALPSVAQRDHEFKNFQRGWTGGELPKVFPTSRPSAAPAEGGAKAPAARVDPAGNQELVIARVMFKRTAADKDRHIRFSPGSIRLVAPKKGIGDDAKWVNYLPIGTYDPAARTLWRNRPDDFLFLNEGADPQGDKGVDLVFYIDKSAYTADSKADAKSPHRFAPGSFLEIKRQLRFDLDGQEVLSGAAALAKFKPLPEIQVMRKPNVVNPPEQSQPTPAPAPTPTPAPAPSPSPDPAAPATQTASSTQPPTPPADNASVVSVKDVKQKDQFFTGLNVPPTGGGPFTTIPGGIAAAKNKKLIFLQITPTDVTRLRGDIIDMFVPDGQGMVQIEADAPSGPLGQAWAFWAEVGRIGLKDDKGTVHKLVGTWASVELEGATHVCGAFQSDPASALLMPRMAQPQGPPSKIWMVAYVPKGAKVKEVVLGNQVLKSGLDVSVQ